MAESALQKSWLFEVFNRKSQRIDTSFTLIMPPQSYTIKEKQRVTITKTFNNAFVDDYGPDNLEITIKGISGASTVFPTFRTKGAAGSMIDSLPPTVSGAFNVNPKNKKDGAGESYDSKGAFYTFRDDIMRYKDAGDFTNKELRVYDLADEQAYKCILLEFSVDRTKEQPFWYPFTINLFVYERMDGKVGAGLKKVENVVSIAKDPLVAIEKVNQNIEKFEELHADAIAGDPTLKEKWEAFKKQAVEVKAKVQAKIQGASSVVDSVTGAIRRFGDTATQIIESPLSAVQYALNLGTDVINAVAGVYVAGKVSILKYTQMEEIVEDSFRNVMGIFGYAISDGTLLERKVDIPYNAGLDTDTGVDEDTGAENDPSPFSTIGSYSYAGLKTYTVTGGDTLQSIALTEMGDTNLWVYIAQVNGFSDNTDIAAGDIIYIPVETNAVSGTGTENIKSQEEVTDPLGIDIGLDVDGNMVVAESSEIGTIEGLDNLIQAINMRLQSIQGSLIKQTAIGISGGAGAAGTSLSMAYLRMSIRNTLIEDPRISNIRNMSLQLSGDQINVNMVVVVTDYNDLLPVTTVI